MIILASKELDKHGISHQAATRLVFQGRLFTKGQTFASRLRDVAVKVAQEELSLGQPCIVIDHETHITLWKSGRSPIGGRSHPPHLS